MGLLDALSTLVRASCLPRASALSIGGLEMKYEMPEVGKCLCLFDVDRTLTSRRISKCKIGA